MMYLLQQEKTVKINNKQVKVWTDIETDPPTYDIIFANRYLMDKKSKGKFRVLSLAQKPMIYDRT